MNHDRQQETLRAQARAPERALCTTISEVEIEQTALAEEMAAVKQSMGAELEWQRDETRRVKALVDGARQMANDAINRYRELEEATAAKVASIQGEMNDVKTSSARECERYWLMLNAEQQDHTATKQVLADERHARGLDALEMEGLHRTLGGIKAALLQADAAKVAAEQKMVVAQVRASPRISPLHPPSHTFHVSGWSRIAGGARGGGAQPRRPPLDCDAGASGEA